MNHHRPWTTAELAQLRSHAHLGATTLAELLDRSRNAIRLAAARNRISLRQPGSRSGLILGQPRGTTWTNQPADRHTLTTIADDIRNGTINATTIETNLRDMHIRTPLCPACTTRPQQRATTGLCHPCHLKALVRAHQDATAERDANRQLWRQRQTASRATRRNT